MALPGITQPIQKERTLSLHGGVNNRDKPWLLGEFVARNLLNLDPRKQGVRTKRGGVSSIGGKSTLAHGLAPSYDLQLDQEVLMAQYGTDVWLLPGNGNLLRVATNATLPSTNYQFTLGRWNSSNAMFLNTLQQDDSNISLAGLLLAIDINRNFSQTASMWPTVATWWQNRLWVADNKVAPAFTNETLWWSQLGDGLSFSTGNTLTVEPGQGGRITGILPVRGNRPQLLIFKEDMIVLFEVFWGSSSSLIPQPADAVDTIASSLRVVAKNAGSISTDSIRYVPGAPDGDVYFLARDGIRALARAQDDALSAPSLPVSLPIQATIDRINIKFAHTARAEVFDNQYFLTVPLDGAVAPSHTIVRDLVTGAWYLYDWAAACYSRARLTQTSNRLFMQYGNLSTDTVPSSNSVESRHTFLCFIDVRDPSNSPIEIIEESRAYSFGELRVRKQWEWAGVWAFNGSATSVMDAYYSVNNGAFTLAPDSPIYFKPGDGITITLGTDPLPWLPSESEMFMRKIDLSTARPGYFIQLKLQSQSDYAQPEIVQTMIAARLWDDEFDNEIT